jgi:hypothetical protein
MATGPMSRFSIVGVFNRFDLASPEGFDCGEYRMVFARNDGPRAFIIFEAVLFNPNQFDGVFGCRPVQEFWAGLTAIADPAQRAVKLRDFYFQGIANFGPVIAARNYGGNGSIRQGQVRVNQFVQAPWELHEFKLMRPGFNTPLQFVPSPVQVNAGESNVDATGNYSTAFSPTGGFAAAIQSELTRIGSALTPANIVARAQALSCAGCHQLSNGASLGGGLTWPASSGFVHATEFQEAGPDGPRFRISPALTSVFLPNRANVLRDFLSRTRCIPNSTRCDFACGFGNGQSSDDCIVKCSADGSTWLPFENCGWAQNGTSSASCQDSFTSPPQATCLQF